MNESSFHLCHGTFDLYSPCKGKPIIHACCGFQEIIILFFLLTPNFLSENWLPMIPL
jgi:hypothetical protein